MTFAGVARNAPPCLSLDIGATKVEVAIVHADGTLSRRERLVAWAGEL
jgi:predicted NBD/HSP70 family sugar kinase